MGGVSSEPPSSMKKLMALACSFASSLSRVATLVTGTVTCVVTPITIIITTNINIAISSYMYILKKRNSYSLLR